MLLWRIPGHKTNCNQGRMRWVNYRYMYTVYIYLQWVWAFYTKLLVLCIVFVYRMFPGLKENLNTKFGTEERLEKIALRPRWAPIMTTNICKIVDLCQIYITREIVALLSPRWVLQKMITVNLRKYRLNVYGQFALNCNYKARYRGSIYCAMQARKLAMLFTFINSYIVPSFSWFCIRSHGRFRSWK